MLYNPKNNMVVRPDRIDKKRFSCDLLRDNLTFIREIATFEGDSLEMAFAAFANAGTIPKSGWFEVSESEFDEAFKQPQNLKLKSYYYGNES